MAHGLCAGSLPRGAPAAGRATPRRVDDGHRRPGPAARVGRPETGRTRARLDVELTNTAPPGGLPAYLIGNELGLPPGTSRLLVSIYSPLGAEAITVSGEPVTIAASRELEWNVYTTSVDVAPGATVPISVDLGGELARPGDLVTWTQPLVNPLEVLG